MLVKTTGNQNERKLRNIPRDLDGKVVVALELGAMGNHAFQGMYLEFDAIDPDQLKSFIESFRLKPENKHLRIIFFPSLGKDGVATGRFLYPKHFLLTEQALDVHLNNLKGFIDQISDRASQDRRLSTIANSHTGMDMQAYEGIRGILTPYFPELDHKKIMRISLGIDPNSEADYIVVYTHEGGEINYNNYERSHAFAFGDGAIDPDPTPSIKEGIRDILARSGPKSLLGLVVATDLSVSYATNLDFFEQLLDLRTITPETIKAAWDERKKNTHRPKLIGGTEEPLRALPG